MYDEKGKLKKIELNAGHFCQDNGCGDFDIMCPEHGKICFVPVLNATIIHGMGCKCGLVLDAPGMKPRTMKEIKLVFRCKSCGKYLNVEACGNGDRLTINVHICECAGKTQVDIA